MNIQSYIVILLAALSLSACHSTRGLGLRGRSAIQVTGEMILVNGQRCPVVLISGHKFVRVNGATVPFEQLRVNQPVSGGFIPSGQQIINGSQQPYQYNPGMPTPTWSNMPGPEGYQYPRVIREYDGHGNTVQSVFF